MPHARRRWPDHAFLAAVTVVALAHVAVVAAGFTVTRVWEDEAYNLTVPLNLAQGNGYSSDGYLIGNGLTPFDIRISTGAAVLVPIAGLIALGLDPVVAGRAVVALYWFALVAGVWLLGRRLAGRWGGLAAVIALLAFDASEGPSPIQGPTDVLGEVPAAAFLAFSVYFLIRRPALSGLMAGLALLCKSLAVLALPVLGIALLLALSGPLKRRIGGGMAFGLAALAPQASFELAKLASLGWDEYYANTRDLYYFLRSGGQANAGVGPLEKLSVLLDSWYLPPAAVIVVAVALVCSAALTLTRGPRIEREHIAQVGGTAGILAVWLAWWLASGGNPAWVRHPAPALLLAVPVVAAAAVRLGRSVSVRGVRHPAIRSALAVAATVLVCVTLGAHVVDVLQHGRESLAQQRAAADRIAAAAPEELSLPWSGAVPMGLLSDVDLEVVQRFEDVEPGSHILIDALDLSAPGREHTAAVVDQYCGDVLAEPRGYVVCELALR